MKAIWKDQVIAEAPKEELIFIEGNWYFPPAKVKSEFYVKVTRLTLARGKGSANISTSAKMTLGAKTTPGVIRNLSPQLSIRLKKTFLITWPFGAIL